MQNFSQVHQPCATALVMESQVKRWEEMGRPDPIREDMRRYVDLLKASHAAAVSEWKEPEDAQVDG